jgi:hypothetical protein
MSHHATGYVFSADVCRVLYDPPQAEDPQAIAPDVKAALVTNTEAAHPKGRARFRMKNAKSGSLNSKARLTLIKV